MPDIKPPELAQFLKRRRLHGISVAIKTDPRNEAAHQEAAEDAKRHVVWKAERGRFVSMVEVARLIEHNTAVIIRGPVEPDVRHRHRSAAAMTAIARKIAARKRQIEKLRKSL